MKKLLYDNDYRTKIIKDYNRLEQLMGEPGCSEKAAEEMVDLLKQSN